MTTHGMDAIKPIVQSIERRISDATQCRAMGKGDWWKVCTDQTHIILVKMYLLLTFMGIMHPRKLFALLLLVSHHLPLIWLDCILCCESIFEILVSIYLQVREAAILAVGTISESIIEVGNGLLLSKMQMELRIQRLLLKLYF